jgi:hypothetical protein
MSEIEKLVPVEQPRLVMPLCGEHGWVGHEWKMRGFYSDECVHCGTIAVEGHNGMKKNWEHCPLRARKISDFKSQHNAIEHPTAGATGGKQEKSSNQK